MQLKYIDCSLEEKEIALSVLCFPPLMSIAKLAQNNPKQILQGIKQQTKVCVSLTV